MDDDATETKPGGLDAIVEQFDTRVTLILFPRARDPTHRSSPDSDADGQPPIFTTYEDYLDNQVTPVDMYYLEDEEMARQLVELGYRGDGEILRREEFDARKEAAFTQAAGRKQEAEETGEAGKNSTEQPLLKALAQRRRRCGTAS